MRLFTSSATPFGRKAQITLLEKNIPFTLELDDIRLPNPKIAPLNPLRKLPVLEIDSETILFDSALICDYLDQAYPETPLIPASLATKTHIRLLDIVAQGILDAAVLIVMEPRFHNEQQISQTWITHQTQKIQQGFSYLANILGEHQYLNHNNFTLADITLGCALAYVEFRLPTIEWRTQHPNLNTYLNNLMQRPSFANTQPKIS
jgi:glutathione S-transferase